MSVMTREELEKRNYFRWNKSPDKSSHFKFKLYTYEQRDENIWAIFKVWKPHYNFETAIVVYHYRNIGTSKDDYFCCIAASSTSSRIKKGNECNNFNIRIPEKILFTYKMLCLGSNNEDG